MEYTYTENQIFKYCKDTYVSAKTNNKNVQKVFPCMWKLKIFGSRLILIVTYVLLYKNGELSGEQNKHIEL